MNKNQQESNSREFFFEFDKESGKLFINILHSYTAQSHNCDESYYGVLFALNNFVAKHSEDPNFFIVGDAYFDKQIYLAMYEAENLKIVVTDNLTEDEANLLADEFIELYNNGFDLTLKNLISSNFIDSSDETLKLKKDNKMVIEKRF